jgi:lipopolysaccharide transport system ATP-binding protein
MAAPLVDTKPHKEAARQSRREARALAISAEGVSKSFLLIDEGDAFRIAFGSTKNIPRFHALKDVTLRAPKGKFVGVLGPNGAGKTTLLRTLGGVYSADSGVIALSGRLGAIYELGVAGNPFLTGRQYAERMLIMRGLNKSARAEMLEDIVEFSELGDRIDDRIQGYSTGMAARLFFAVATAGFYDVYLIDEVLSVGDQYFQAKCWRRIKERIENGASGVLVTHDWSTIVKVCAEAHILENGRIVYSGPPEQVVRRQLYGEAKTEPYVRGVASIVERPEAAIVVRQGEPLVVAFDVEIVKSEPVSALAVVEKLKTGIGWETILMSREPTLVGRTPGRHRVEVRLDPNVLAPGEYVFSASLVQKIPDQPSYHIYDSFGWLSGSGLPILVEGQGEAFALPARWRLDQP